MRRILLLDIYRPPSGDCKEIYDAVTNANIKYNSDLFIMGDMNIDL